MIIELTEDLEIEVEYDYQPFEKRTLNHPGAYEEATLTDLKVTKGSIADLLYFLNVDDKINKLILKQKQS